ncbi:MAG: discoidin domain-containing protein, partial [Acidimicrobiia bacterium]
HRRLSTLEIAFVVEPLGIDDMPLATQDGGFVDVPGLEVIELSPNKPALIQSVGNPTNLMIRGDRFPWARVIPMTNPGDSVIPHSRRRIRLVMMFGVVALIAAACSSSGGDGVIRDFSEIQSSDFEFTVDANGVARMTVSTSIDAACSISYGETDALGTIGTDDDMGGAAHDEHEVILVDAEPGKTYKFRVQGADAEGNIYQSAIATFTLPEVPDSGGESMVDRGANVAEGATVLDVSSVFSGSWSGQNAFDGDMTTEWATKGSGDDAYIVIDLGSAQPIAGVEFITRTMSDGTATTTEYTVTVDDGETYGPFPAGDQSDPGFTEVEFTGQVLRFDVAVSTGGNTGAIEIRAFARSRG